MLIKWNNLNSNYLLLAQSSVWYFNQNENINKLNFNLYILLKNKNLVVNSLVKILSLCVFSYWNFKQLPFILKTKKDLASFRIRKNTVRGVKINFRKSLILFFFNFCNQNKLNLKINEGFSFEFFTFFIKNLLTSAETKSLIYGQNYDIFLRFKFKNFYNYKLYFYFLFFNEMFKQNLSKEQLNILLTKRYIKNKKFYNNFIKFNKILQLKKLMNQFCTNNLIINIFLYNKVFNYKFKNKNTNSAYMFNLINYTNNKNFLGRGGNYIFNFKNNELDDFINKINLENNELFLNSSFFIIDKKIIRLKKLLKIFLNLKFFLNNFNSILFNNIYNIIYILEKKCF